MTDLPVFGAGIWHFATYVDRYATDGYGAAGRAARADRQGRRGRRPVRRRPELAVRRLRRHARRGQGRARAQPAPGDRDHAGDLQPRLRQGLVHQPRSGRPRPGLELLNEAAELAKELGCDYVKLWPGQDGWDYPFQVELPRHVEAGRRRAARAVRRPPRPQVRHRVQAARAAEQDHLPERGATLLGIEQIGLDNVGILLDFGHSLYGLETPADAAQLCIDHGQLFAIDVNDNFRGWDDDMVVGSVHLVETFEFFYTLRKNNWEGVWQLDQFPFREDSVAGRQSGDPLPQGAAPALWTRSTWRRCAAAQAWHDALAAQRLVQDVLLSSMARTTEDDCMTALAPEHTTMPVARPAATIRASRDEQIAHIAEAARQIRHPGPEAGPLRRSRPHRRRLLRHRHPRHALRGRAERHSRDRRRPRAGPVHPVQGPRCRRALHHAGCLRLPAGRGAGHLPEAAVAS